MLTAVVSCLPTHKNWAMEEGHTWQRDIACMWNTSFCIFPPQKLRHQTKMNFCGGLTFALRFSCREHRCVRDLMTDVFSYRPSQEMKFLQRNESLLTKHELMVMTSVRYEARRAIAYYPRHVLPVFRYQTFLPCPPLSYPILSYPVPRIRPVHTSSIISVDSFP